MSSGFSRVCWNLFWWIRIGCIQMWIRIQNVYIEYKCAYEGSSPPSIHDCIQIYVLVQSLAQLRCTHGPFARHFMSCCVFFGACSASAAAARARCSAHAGRAADPRGKTARASRGQEGSYIVFEISSKIKCAGSVRVCVGNRHLRACGPRGMYPLLYAPPQCGTLYTV